MSNPTQKPLVVVFVTGGTIVSRFDAVSNTIAPLLSGEELISSIGDTAFCDIELIEFCNMPGPHLTPQLGLALAKEVRAFLGRDEVSGAVIVQGTDTLEEMAYLFHLILDSSKPVVFTGAMKSLNEPYTDAQGNLLGALRLAACQEARSQGILVYFNQEILSARYVVKHNANNMDSFKAMGTGPTGVINNDTITFFHRLEQREHYEVAQLNADIQLVTATCGMSPLLIETCVANRVDGIVLEGFGAGNLPPNVLPSVSRAVAQGISVVMVTRCMEGFASGTYSYEGGGADLESLGVLFGGDLNGPKARMKLMVLCSINKAPSYIKKHL